MVNIFVTEERIATGKRNDCWACPVALAINSVLKPGYVANVDTDLIEIHAGDYTGVAIVTPDRIVDFISQFDLDYTMEPEVFRINIPAEYLRADLC